MPSPPPITDGLNVWLCSDTNVDKRPDETVVSWGAADGSGLQAAAIGSSRPQWVGDQINGYPVLRFAGAQGLFLETGVIAQDSFTLVVVGRSIDERQYGGEGLAGQKMLFYQDGSAALTHAAVSVGWNGVGVYEFGAGEAPRAEVNDVGADCLCPLVVRYESKALKVWLGGGLVIDDGSVPSQPVNAPHGIGGTGDATGGFAGDIAEVLIYNRALSDGERQQVEQYVLEKYACGPSSSSSASSEMSSWSSEQSSWQSSEQSSEQSSSQESSWSSQESSWSSEWSSEQSSEQSSMEPSSSCSPVLPPDPVPVTEGLVAWQRADVDVSLDGNNQITDWGGANGCLPDAQRVTGAGPAWQENSFGVQPAVVFSGSEGLVLQSAGELGGDSFTLVVAACSDSLWELGSLFGPESSQSGAVAAVAASMGQTTLSEPGGSGGVRLSADTPGCLCPLTIIYENKQARIYWLGNLVAQDSSAPSYDIWLPKLIGGTGSGGFVGRVAELLFYNRALGDSERQQVEAYLQDRYQCLPSGSSEMSSEQSSEMSSEQSSEESSSEESLSSSSSSSSSEGSEIHSSSSSESSSAPGGIYFTTSLVELLNPHASDFDWTEVGIVNETGTPVVYVEFQSMFESEGFAAVAEANDDSPLELTAEMKDPSTVSIKAAAWGINTKYGKAGATFNATFKDSQGSVIGTSTIGIEAMATIRGSLEQSRDLAEFNPQFRASFSQPFYQTAATIAFNNTNAPSEIQFGVSDSIMVQDALFKADLSATINDLENISIKRLVAAGSFEIPFVQTTTVQTSLVGSFENVFSEEFPGNYQMNWTGGIGFEGRDNNDVFFGLEGIDIRATSQGQGAGWSGSAALEMKGGKARLKLRIGVPNQ